jgi:hypothetical protein
MDGRRRAFFVLFDWMGARSVFDGGPASWCDAPAYQAALRQLGVIRPRA